MAFLGAFTRKLDRLVREHTTLGIIGVRFIANEAQVAFDPHHKTALLLHQAVQPCKVNVATVQHDAGALG